MAASAPPELEGAPQPRATRPAAEFDAAEPRRWRRRPVLRAAVRLAAVLAPVVAASAVAIVYSRSVPVPAEATGMVVWWVVFAAAIVTVWLLSAELLQATLPLATLLDLALVFPDAVPSRFAILRRKIDRRRLETDLRRLRERSDPDSAPRAQLILELAVALSIHDSRTRGHSERVRMFTDLVAKELHLRERDIDRLRWAALLHDIGKLAVAPEILNKPELPDDDELESLRSHPVEGYRMIAPLHRWLGQWAAAVRDHHERFDGTGYPSGLRGRAISLGGRIVAVTDSYETMTAGRPYRKALSMGAAREELVRRSGTHFDPDVVRALLGVSLGRLWPVIGIGALLAEVTFLGGLPWRLGHLGSRSLSAFAAAAATTTLLLAGLAGPLGHVPAFAPAVRGPQLAQVQAQAAAPTVAPQPSTPSPSPSASPPGATTLAAPAPTATPPTTAGPGGPSAGGGSLYPAGIAKRPVLPAGIAKKTNPFARWRTHH